MVACTTNRLGGSVACRNRRAVWQVDGCSCHQGTPCARLAWHREKLKRGSFPEHLASQYVAPGARCIAQIARKIGARA